MKFKTLIIVTYGRSGSTLLQGILNNIEDVIIKGENYNFYYPLFEAYKRLEKIKKTHGKGMVLKPENSWYGVHFYESGYFLDVVKKMAEHYILGNDPGAGGIIENREKICYGFKEIRYYEAEDELDEYLSFLRKILPDLGVIFNTRNHEDTVKSWMRKRWAGFEKYKENEWFSNIRFFSRKRKAFKEIEESEKRMKRYYEKNKEHSFWIDYKNMCDNDSKVEELYQFIGFSYDKKSVDEVLKIKHSY